MPLEDINKATFQREAERVLAADDCKKAVANFATLNTAEERLNAFRGLRKGSVISAPSTKLGSITYHN
jgi:hypothetical protein